jgi:hypothetical protein
MSSKHEHTRDRCTVGGCELSGLGYCTNCEKNERYYILPYRIRKIFYRLADE